MPMADYRAHLPPGFQTIKWLAAQKAHHFGISTERRVRLKVFEARQAQDQAFSFKSNLGHQLPRSLPVILSSESCNSSRLASSNASPASAGTKIGGAIKTCAREKGLGT